jgi:hypothetical protein
MIRPKRMSGTKFLAQLPIKYIHAFRDRHGKTRHYFRRPGFKPVPLPGLPGSAEFIAAYQAALAGESAPRIEIGTARKQIRIRRRGRSSLFWKYGLWKFGAGYAAPEAAHS